nr:MAG TPA: hypothetical protein [Caudoviricetes sp.]
MTLQFQKICDIVATIEYGVFRCRSSHVSSWLR